MVSLLSNPRHQLSCLLVSSRQKQRKKRREREREAEDAPTGFEQGVFPANVGTRDDTRSADEGGANVAHDRTVQVRHDHDVELLGAVHELHRGVVDAVSHIDPGQRPCSPRNVVPCKGKKGEGARTHIMSEKVMPESLYSSAIRRHVLRKRPSPSFMMLALWTAVTCCRGG